jgi:hypothetical protein
VVRSENTSIHPKGGGMKAGKGDGWIESKITMIA